MPNLQPTRRVRAPLFAMLLAAAGACGGGADGDADSGAYFDEGADAPRVDIDACALLTKEEVAEQLYLAVRPDERVRWTSKEFDISATEQDNGASRLCEYRFESRYAIGGGPVWHSDFTLMVFPSNAVALPEEKRRPIEGGTAGMFRESGAGTVYVVKGPHAVSISSFPGREEDEPGGPDAGRLALLRQIAERLP